MASKRSKILAKIILSKRVSKSLRKPKCGDWMMADTSVYSKTANRSYAIRVDLGIITRSFMLIWFHLTTFTKTNYQRISKVRAILSLSSQKISCSSRSTSWVMQLKLIRDLKGWVNLLISHRLLWLLIHLKRSILLLVITKRPSLSSARKAVEIFKLSTRVEPKICFSQLMQTKILIRQSQK